MTTAGELESVPCPLCGNAELEPVTSRGQFGLPCHVVICPRDGFVFLSPRWTKARYASFYAHEYDRFYRPQALPDLEHLAQRHFATLLERVTPHLSRATPPGVLDVGAGMGFGLRWLARARPELGPFWAIESSEACALHLRREPDIQLLSTDVDEGWPDVQVGVCIMRHVLEHFLDPVDLLHRVRASLADGGLVYIAVPDMMHPRGSLSASWFRTVHTSYFSRPTLTDVARRAGLAPLAMGTHRSEVWGLFAKTEAALSTAAMSTPASDEGTYRAQRAVLAKHKLLDVALAPVSRAAPPGARRRVREALRRRPHIGAGGPRTDDGSLGAPLRDQLARDGFVVVPGVLDVDEVARLRGEVLRYFARHGNFSTGGRSQPNAAIVVPQIAWVLTHPRILAMYRSVLGSDGLMYTNQCDIHQSRLSRWHKDSGGVDNAYFDHAPFDDEGCRVYKTALYLQGHVDGSGLTVRRGSHQTGDHQAGEALAVDVKAGDAILFDVRLTHVGQEPDLVETALWALCGGDWNDARYMRWKQRYWRARGREDRCSVFFTFGAANEQTVAFSVNNMKRQLEQSPSGTNLSRSVRNALLAAGVELAEDHFPF